jgi:excisionase family DNA binding protein
MTMSEHTRDPFDLLTVPEVAAELRCSESTVRRAIHENRIPWFRLREHGSIRVPYFGLENLIAPELHKATELATRATSEVEA